MPDGRLYGITETLTGLSIRIYVTPRASANKVVGEHNGALKVSLTAPPVEGAANKALLEFLAKALGVSRASLRLASGETSRNKVVQVAGISVQDALDRLGLARGADVADE